MLSVWTLLMFACISGAFGNGGQLFSRVLCKTVTLKLLLTSFVYYIWAAEFDVLNLILPRRFCALLEKHRFCATEEGLCPLSCEMRANVWDQSLLTIIKDCIVDLVLALLAYPQTSMID